MDEHIVGTTIWRDRVSGGIERHCIFVYRKLIMFPLSLR